MYKIISLLLILFTALPTYGACTSKQTALMNRLFYDGFSGGHMDVIDEVFHPDFELNHPSLPPGIDGVKAIVRMNNTAFENWRFAIQDIICEENKIVARYSATGIHTNSFMGEVPTNKSVTLNGISIFVIRNNKIIKDWYMPDDLNFLIQLGLIPPLPQPPSNTQ